MSDDNPLLQGYQEDLSKDIFSLSREILKIALTKHILVNKYSGEIIELSPTTVINLAKYVLSNKLDLGLTNTKELNHNAPTELFNAMDLEDTEPDDISLDNSLDES